MTAEQPTVEVDARALAALQQELSELTDLFKRRLFEDRSKNALIETIQEHVRATNDLLRYRDFEGLFREVLLAIDRLQSEPLTPELAQSVSAEMLEVFRRRDLVPVPDSGRFDPRVHEAVGTVPAGDGQAPNTITEVHRKGYVLGDRLVRPARVTVAVSVDDRSA